MKKSQKRLGNKGFSLVELIVVIAIMAVLVGVLAPTLIKNVEKSRKSKDEQNLDTLRGAIVNALADEATYNALVPTSGDVVVVTLDGASGALTKDGKNAVSTEITDNLGSTTVKMTSKSYNTLTLEFKVDAKGKVTGPYNGDSLIEFN